MPVSKLDVVYRKVLLTKYFIKGWGSPENLIRIFNFRHMLSNRETCYKLVPKSYNIKIITDQRRADCRKIVGKFRSPIAYCLPELMTEAIEDAYFEMILPTKWKRDGYKPICIHLAGTGDHYFWRRRNLMAKPLLKAGIGSIILENPYYGLRKPKCQIRSCLHYVSDIFVMGGCLVLECIVLLNWCEDLGFGPLGVTGISMGGHMASLAASNWPKPIVLVPCLSWSTASSVFTEGVMSESIDWDMLQSQYKSNALYSDTLSKMCKIVDDPFACSLSKTTEGISKNYVDEKVCYVTPYEMLCFMNSAEINCKAINYKQTSQINRLPTFTSSKYIRDIRKRDKEALWFMRGIMDECTHLKNFSVPVDTSLIISVCAKSDGYVPRIGVSTLDDLWPGVTVKYVDCGHVGAYLWHRGVFKQSIIEGFNRAKKVLEPPNPSLQNIFC